MKANRRKRLLKVFSAIGIILILIAAFIVFEIHISYNWLSVNHFDYESEKIDEPVKIVILSDLHDHDFGDALIEKIEEQKPDLILMAGDMLNNYSENTDLICSVISRLKDIAPVYYGLGNHEESYMETYHEFVQEIETAGCIMLDCEYLDIRVNDNDIRIGGLYDYPYGMGDCNAEDAEYEIAVFMQDFIDTDRFKILIAHRPESFLFGDDSVVYPMELVVSGHLHGGQVVLPFKGGIWGGDQGLFPKYIHGLYEKNNIHMIITSGLGSSKKKVPRFNNIPEIMVLTLHE